MNDSMQGGLDLDCLDDSDFFYMKQLSSACDNELFDVLHNEPPLSRAPHQLDYSPLSCKVEDTLMFDFPHPSPPACHLQVRPDAGGLPSAFPSRESTAAACRRTAEDVVDAKPTQRRGRKRLPETVSISLL